MLAWSESALGRFEAALELLRRAGRLAGASGRELVLVLVSLGSVRPLRERGRLAEAMAMGEEAVDRARLSGAPQQLLAAYSALSTARLAAGDVSAALREAEDAAAIDAPHDFHRAAQPGWCLGAALTAAGNAERGQAAMLEAFGGAAMPRVIPAERPAAAADLVEAQLAAGELAAANETLRYGVAAAGEAGTAWAAATIARARAAVLLTEGQADEAVAAADEAVEAAAPFAVALARLAQGRGARGDRRSRGGDRGVERGGGDARRLRRPAATRRGRARAAQARPSRRARGA